VKKLLLVVPVIFYMSCCKRYPDLDGGDARSMMSQTVKVSVNIRGVTILKGENDEAIISDSASGWTGSGVVIASDSKRGKGESLVMTAAHITSIPAVLNDGFSTLVVRSSAIVVTTLDGAECLATTVYEDVPNDVSVIRTSCVAGEVAEIATSMPPVGAFVSTSGAALGIHPMYMFVVTDGRYVGSEDGFDGQTFLTLPAASGHSGSGVFYRGKVFGIISKKYEFEHAVLAVRLASVIEAYKSSMETWNGR